MSQRSYANDRNRKGAKIGSTRKSAAKAKPVRQQGSAESSKPASKQKKKSEIEKDWSGLPTSPEIKKWRKVWWVLLIGGLALIGISYAIPEIRGNEGALKVISVGVLGLSGAAIAIDLVVIRKLRTKLMEAQGGKKSSKGKTAAAGSPKDTEPASKKGPAPKTPGSGGAS